MEYLDKMQAAHNEGDPIAVHEVALFCIWNGRPLPAWATPEIEAMIQRDMHDRPGRGKGEAAPSVKAFRLQRDAGWHASVETIRAFGMGLKEAQLELDRRLRLADRHLPENAVVGAYQRHARRLRALNKVGP